MEQTHKKTLRKTNVLERNHQKPEGKTNVLERNLQQPEPKAQLTQTRDRLHRHKRKPKENQRFKPTTKENMRKTIVSEQKPKKT